MVRRTTHRIQVFITMALWVIFLTCIPTGCKKSPSSPTPPAYPARITFSGVGSHGIFDPSVQADPATSRIWMSYSAVDPSAAWPVENPDVVSTRLAYSDNRGADWIETGAVVNPCVDVDLSPLPAPLHAGTWQNEVSSLVYEPNASPAERWKLFWMHYLVAGNLRLLSEHAWIGMKSAASPELLASAPEVKLFSSYGYDPENNSTTGATHAPLGGAPLIALDQAFGGALTGGIFAEPGLMATSSALYLSMLCVNPPSQHRIILMKCGSPCDPTLISNWTLVGTLLDDASGMSQGVDQGFSAPDLVASGTSFYLIATPVSSAPFDGFYSGTRVYRFNDLDTGSLSTAAPYRAVNGDAGSFNGAGTYEPAADAAGLVYSQLVLSAVDRFRIMKSGVNF